jgi:hypothetical protein
VSDRQSIDIAVAIRAHVAHARAYPGAVERCLIALAELADRIEPLGGAIKVCGCGATYDAATWSELRLVGVQDDGVERVELRDCAGRGGTCRSTIGLVLGPSTGLVEEGGGPAGTAEVGPTDEPAEKATDEAAGIDSGPGADGEGQTTLPRRTHAGSRTDCPDFDPPETATGPAVCEASGCGQLLTPAQRSHGARACSPACRAKAHRETRKARRLRGIDDATRLLAELRSEIAADRRG